ncbi:MAG: radical SAM protein [Clostridia bacterium]|nr:radical SAM protein [Clostridia bacterium]
MKRIQLIIKVTNGCNLRCKYCYNAGADFKHETIAPEKIEKLISLFDEHDEIGIIFHGGEPLLAGREFYEKVLEIEKRLTVASGVKFVNSVQTNATLLDEKWLNFFKKHHIAVGISFDGLYNDEYRGKTEDTLKAIELLRKNKMHFGCIAVVADKNYDIRKNYDYLKQFGMPVDFSYVFIEGNAKDIDVLPVQSYVEQMVELFDVWMKDKEGTSVRNFTYMMNKILKCGGEYCGNGSCIGNFFCMDKTGSIYGCSREAAHKYCFGNVDDAKTKSDIFNSQGFKEYIGGAIVRRKSCADKCEFFDYCKGGCTDEAISHGDITKQNPQYCYFFKTMYKHVKSRIDELLASKADLSEYNPHFKKALVQATSIPENDNI